MLNWQDRRILLDVAHNPAGAAYLADWLLQHQMSPVRTVFSALADKDYGAAMSCLKPHTLQWYLAPLPVARGESLQNLLQAAAGMQVPLRGFDTIAAALRGAVEDSRPGDVILVCGSFYSVAEAMGCLSSGGS